MTECDHQWAFMAPVDNGDLRYECTKCGEFQDRRRPRVRWNQVDKPPRSTQYTNIEAPDDPPWKLHLTPDGPVAIPAARGGGKSSVQAANIEALIRQRFEERGITVFPVGGGPPLYDPVRSTQEIIHAALSCAYGEGAITQQEERQAHAWLEHKEKTMPLSKQEQIDRAFTYHAPKDDQPARYTAIRAAAKGLAELIIAATPESREQSLALTHLEETTMWANAAIARNE